MGRSTIWACMAVVLLGAAACGDGNPRTTADAGRVGVDAGPSAGGAPVDGADVDAGADGGTDGDAGPDGGDDGGLDDGGMDAGPDAGGLCSGVDCASLDGPCAVGVCDPETGTCGAQSRPDDTPCDDGALCTEGDVCTAGVCAGTDLDCSALDGPCAVGMCAPSTGMCFGEPSADETLCDDGFVCTMTSACAAGACEGAGLACTVVETDLTTTTTTTSVGGSGGSAAMGTCPAGEVLIGFRGEIETGNALPDRPGLTRGVCAAMDIDPAGTIATAETGTIGPFAAGDDPMPRTTWERMCPADEVVVGFSARATSFVLQLTFRCAPLSLGDARAGYPVEVGAAADLMAVGDGTGTILGPHDCAAGEAAVGVEGRAGAWIDRWSLECAPLTGGL